MACLWKEREKHMIYCRKREEHALLQWNLKQRASKTLVYQLIRTSIIISTLSSRALLFSPAFAPDNIFTAYFMAALCIMVCTWSTHIHVHMCECVSEGQFVNEFCWNMSRIVMGILQLRINPFPLGLSIKTTLFWRTPLAGILSSCVKMVYL